jgi:outer membrane protein OmpA-like peptidoglycan-associated protein
MVTIKKLPILFLALALILPGCGKKKEEKKIEKNTVAQAHKPYTVAQKSSQIPVLSEEVEDFFDDDAISEFAFVDDDFMGDVEDENLEDLFQTSPGFNKKAPKKEAKADVALDSFFDEDDSFVSWEDDDYYEDPDVSFKTVQFDLNKNSVRSDQKSIIQKDIESAKVAVDQGKKIVVQGHCCQLGAPSFNMALSEKRAKVIKDEMIKNGIPAENIKTIGMGQEMPLVWSDKTSKLEKINELAPNRRAEIVVN